MKDRLEILSHLEFLLDSAESRSTEQGANTYTEFVASLAAATSKTEMTWILSRLDRHLSGIEAHGHFTNREYEAVIKIRDLSKNYV